jgi:hypothetical protein
MSEIGWYKSQLRVKKAKGNPSFHVLQQALEMVAHDHKGKLTSEITDYYGKKRNCESAIILPEFPRGIGIKIEQDGTVNFAYDAFGGYEKVVQNIINEITQCYTTISLIRVMKSLGYRVTDESIKSEKTVRLIARI